MSAPAPFTPTPATPLAHFTQTESAAAQSAWEQLSAFVSEWFYGPDIDAFRINLSVAASHFTIQSDPVWLFNIGVPGCGKTSMGINCLLKLPGTYVMGDLTERTLISGFKTNPGLLHQIGPSGIMLFKDFTTILSKRPDTKAEIVAQLREVYDGRFQRVTGAKSMVPPWEGKITVIAAVTPSVENHWALMRELGERFLHVWWSKGDGVERGRFARKQRGKEKFISRTLAELTLAFLQPQSLRHPVSMPTAHDAMLDNLSEIVAIMRGAILHIPGSRDIPAHSPIIEVPTRIAKSLEYIATTHAAIMRRDINADDIRLMKRVAFDTIPSGRRIIWEHIPLGSSIGRLQLIQLTGLAESTCDYYVAALEALGVIQGQHNTVEKVYSFTPRFARLMEKAEILT